METVTCIQIRRFGARFAAKGLRVLTLHHTPITTVSKHISGQTHSIFDCNPSLAPNRTPNCTQVRMCRRPLTIGQSMFIGQWTKNKGHSTSLVEIPSRCTFLQRTTHAHITMSYIYIYISLPVVHPLLLRLLQPRGPSCTLRRR
jgi:hypothetical protein